MYLNETLTQISGGHPIPRKHLRNLTTVPVIQCCLLRTPLPPHQHTGPPSCSWDITMVLPCSWCPLYSLCRPLVQPQTPSVMLHQLLSLPFDVKSGADGSSVTLRGRKMCPLCATKHGQLTQVLITSPSLSAPALGGGVSRCPNVPALLIDPTLPR